MSAVELSGAPGCHFSEIRKLRVRRVSARIAASDAVASLVAELAFGPTRRGDVAALHGLTAERVAAAGVGVRS